MAVFDSKTIQGSLIILSSYAQKAGQLVAFSFKVKSSQILPIICLLIDWSQKPIGPDRDCLQGLVIELNLYDGSDDWLEHVNLSLLFHPLASDEMRSACFQHLNLHTAPISQKIRKPHSTFATFHHILTLIRNEKIR